MELQEGQKVTVIEKYTKYHVVIAKRGSVGIIKNFGTLNSYKNGIPYKEDSVIIEQAGGKIVEVPLPLVKPYEKKEVKTVKMMDDTELVDAFELLVMKEVHATSTKTKAYQKIVKDIEKYKQEILKRMSN